MSLDDHIQHLSDTIVGELRAPIEASLRQLLGEVFATATHERDESIARAVAEATGRHEAELATLRADAEQRLRESLQSVSSASTLEAQEALEALRSSAAADRDQALAALEADLVRLHETELARLRESTAAEVSAAIEQARAEIVEQREAAAATWRAEREELIRQYEEEMASLQERHAAELEAAEQDLAREREARAAVEPVAADAGREGVLQSVRDEAARERETAVQAARDEAARIHDTALQAALDAASREREAAVQAAREDAAREVEAAVQAAREDAAREVEAAAQAARDEAARELSETAAGQQGRDDQARDMLRDTIVGQRQAELACSERLLDGFRQLDAGRTLSEVLAVLTDRIGQEAGRSALLLAEGERLRGWRLAGFPPGLEPSDLDVPLEEAGVLARAASSGAACPADPGSDELPALLLAPNGRAGLAVPLLVGQRAVAVLYADDGSDAARPAPSNWPETAEVLARHAARCLEVMTIARVAGPIAQRALPPVPEAAGGDGAGGTAAPAAHEGPEADAEGQAESARRYARLLLSEVKLYNEGAVEEGRRDANLLARLGPEIERARRLYEEKIPAGVRERGDWFDQELVRTLAGGDAALLGQVT